MVRRAKIRFIARHRKSILKFLGVLAALGVLGYVFIARPALRLYANAKEGQVLARQLKSAAATQDFAKLSTSVTALEKLLIRTKGNYSRLAFFKVFPVARNYYKDGEHFLTAGEHGLKAALIVLNALSPFKDALGWGGPTLLKVSGEEKLAQLVQVMPQILPQLEQATTEIDKFRLEISEINPQRYPQEIRGIQIRKTLTALRDSLNSTQEILQNSRPALRAVPKALGAATPQNYLVLFQNDKELRPTGGFLTAYALVRFTAGKMSVIKSGDIHELDGDRSYLPGPSVLLQVLQLPNWYLRDTNFSPDFRKSMQDFELYYKNNSNPPIDGIIALDTSFVESFLEISGPVTVPEYATDFSGYANLPDSCRAGGNSFTSQNVVCRLELYAERLLAKTQKRKALLGDLMNHLIDWAFNAPPNKWYDLIQNAVAQAGQKHVLLYLHDQTLQDLAEDYNFAGRVKNPESAKTDYLYVNDANLAGQKSDLYMQRVIKQEISVAADGAVTKEVTLTYTNTGPWDGWLNTYNRTYVRILVPLGSHLVSSTGGTRATTAFQDLGKTVFDNFLVTAPGATSTLRVEYELPFKLKKGGEYKLAIQKQPGKGVEKYQVKVGKQTQEIRLETDKEVVFSL